ncbi:MAG: DUF447 domain-containing protein [Promethearchaeota archaeon]
MSFDPKDFGLKRFNLYEIIATSYSLVNNGSTIKPNAACMGIKLIEERCLQISPFSGTKTYENLKKYKIIAVNFVEDICLYTLAALKGSKSLIELSDFPSEYYNFKYLEDYKMDVPYIKKAWGFLIGKVSEESYKTKKNDFGEVSIPLFKLNVIYSEKLQESHKLFNRAENLVLETIILATRLKLAKETGNEPLFNKIQLKINDHIENIQRFGKNKKALKSIELIKKYIKF